MQGSDYNKCNDALISKIYLIYHRSVFMSRKSRFENISNDAMGLIAFCGTNNIKKNSLFNSMQLTFSNIIIWGSEFV